MSDCYFAGFLPFATLGPISSIRKKFKADMYQRHYQSFADQFGLTKRQCQDAIARLVKLGLLRRELRIVDTPQGKISNVPFFEPVIDALQRVTYHVSTYDPPRSNVIAPTSDRDTYTENPTETTTESTQESNGAAAPAMPAALKQLPAIKAYYDLHNRYPTTAQMRIIAERNPPIADWVRAIRAWAAAGHKPTNIEGMLDWAFDPSRMDARTKDKPAGKQKRNYRPDEYADILLGRPR